MRVSVCRSVTSSCAATQYQLRTGSRREVGREGQDKVCVGEGVQGEGECV